MIVPMIRLRVLGPLADLDDTLSALQDLGVMHLAEPRTSEGLRHMARSEQEERQARNLQRIIRDVEALGPELPGPGRPSTPAAGTGTARLAHLARAAGRVRRELTRLDQGIRALEAERAEVMRYRQFLTAFRGLVPGGGKQMQSYHLILRGEDTRALPRLREAIAGVLGEHFALESASLPSGERAVLLLVPVGQSGRIERLLAESGVHELPLPAAVAAEGRSPVPQDLEVRRQAIDEELARLRRRRAELLSAAEPELRSGLAAAGDRLIELEARQRAGATARTFVLEGWVPGSARVRLERVLRLQVGERVVVEEVGREEWRGEEAPVILANPRLFRPFETLTGMMPLPRYGTIDPTPFMAVFFPMFFGLILGDIGYGLVLAGVAGLLHRRTRPGTAGRAVAEILGPCAAFSIAFGVAFGEFFGDLGRHWFGQEPLVFDREKSLLPFLGLAVTIGFVHIVLGQVLGIVNAARGEPRHAIGRTAALVMVLLVVLALLAGIRVLPAGFFTPAVVALLVAFPVLVIAEGIVAPIEFLSTISNMLSYARIMALGTASVMMAVVANRLAGSFGSIVVGAVFALLFHLVNFALGIFAPTIHGLRLHYVEFFGKFYSPGGTQYRPLGHWKPGRTDHPLPSEGSS
jgi:V/A-type H+-transporting ATPase subunit I